MAGVVSFVQDVAWLMKNAALRKDVPVLQMATVVTGGNPPTVMLDGTTTQRQVTRNMAGKLRTGQRVRLEVQGTNVTILAAVPASFGPQDLTMVNGWGSLGGIYTPTISREGPTVYLTGLATRGSAGIAAALPEWARPLRTQRLTCTSGNHLSGLMGVSTEGNLSYEAGWWSAAPTGYVALGHSWEAAN